MKAVPVCTAQTRVDDDLAELLQAVRLGCRVSFTRLYALTSGRLFGVILRINKVRSEAEEVLQEAYIAIWNRCSQYRASKGKVINWLIGIAHNLAISSLRYRAVRPQPDASAEADEADAYAGLRCHRPEPLDVVMQTQASGAVRDCLAGLSAEHRQCFALAFYDGLSHQQIAHRLGRPAGTVKSWLRRTLTTMRPALSAHQ